MAKIKHPKGGPNRHLHARVTFLYQAATYLTLQADPGASKTEGAETITNQKDEPPSLAYSRSKPALHLAEHLRAVSLKGQTRLSTDFKRSICKTCNALLIPGRTSTRVLRNESKGGSKPWADVMEVGCDLCGSKKRFPVGANRQQRRIDRNPSRAATSLNKETADVLQASTPTVTTSNGQTPIAT